MTNGMMTNGIDSDMPKYDINKLRSAGLRYLAVDKDGQAWAIEIGIGIRTDILSTAIITMAEEGSPDFTEL